MHSATKTDATQILKENGVDGAVQLAAYGDGYRLTGVAVGVAVGVVVGGVGVDVSAAWAEALALAGALVVALLR
jgi:hypothetical protein